MPLHMSGVETVPLIQPTSWSQSGHPKDESDVDYSKDSLCHAVNIDRQVGHNTRPRISLTAICVHP